MLVVTPWFPSAAHTGAGIFNLRDAQTIARDHEVRVLHLVRPDWFAADAPAGEVEGIPVERVPFAAGDPRTWRRARAAIRAALADADLLHTMAFPALLPFTGLRVRTPWVHTEHWSGLMRRHTGPKGVVDSLMRRVLRRPDEVVAVSDALAERIAPWTRRSPQVIGNAVPFPPEGAVSRPPAPGERLRIIGIAGIVPHKGPLLAVEAVAELVRRGVAAELRWAGVGEQRDDMEARAAELGLGTGAGADGVDGGVVLLGQLARPELEQELLAAHAFVLPTERETFGVAIAEALACGLPVVVTGEGGHVSVLDGFAGVGIAERSAPRIADGLLEVLADDTESRRAERAHLAHERFSEEMRRESYRRVYAEVSRGSGVTGR